MTLSVTMPTLARAVTDAVRSVTGGPVPHHHAPYVTERDTACVMDQLQDLGSYRAMHHLEVQASIKCGRKHAIAVSSGSAALEIALIAAGVLPDQRVIIPAVAFIAAANAVTRIGAIPEFLDVEPGDGIGLDPSLLARRIQQYPRPAAIIAVHVLGHPCDILSIVGVAGDIPVIEDAAEALGSEVQAEGGNMACGSFGVVSILSFNTNKIVTGGGGGMVMTDIDQIAETMRSQATTARIPHPWLIEHDAVAWNHRMTTPTAALVLSQIKRLHSIMAAKRKLAAAYRAAFYPIEEVEFVEEPPMTMSNFWLPAIRVPDGTRDAVLTALHEAGISARALFTPLNQLKPYRRPDPYPVAAQLHRRTVCLPGGVKLAERFA